MKRKLAQTIYGTGVVVLLFTLASEFKANATAPALLIDGAGPTTLNGPVVSAIVVSGPPAPVKMADPPASNTLANAMLRAPYQGAEIIGFVHIQSTADSVYNSLQMSLTRRFSKGGATARLIYIREVARQRLGRSRSEWCN